MSIASEITRISTLRDTIRTKLLAFGVITDSSAKLSACSEAIDSMNESVITIPNISVTPSVTVNTSTGVITVSGNDSGAISVTKGYSKGASEIVSADVSSTYQMTVYDGTVS